MKCQDMKTQIALGTLVFLGDSSGYFLGERCTCGREPVGVPVIGPDLTHKVRGGELFGDQAAASGNRNST